VGEQATVTASVRPGKRARNWWSTWWPFGLAWPAAALLIVLGTWAGYALDSRLPTLVLFPFAAAVSTTELHRSGAVAAALFGHLPVYALIARVGVRRQHSRTAMATVAAFHLAGIVLGSPLFWGPSLPAFGRRLAETAGPGARDCGVVPLSRDRAAAISCARSELTEGRPFYVAFQVMGIDSTIYEGLAYRGPGQATRILWDSDITGGYNLVPIRRIREETCSALAIANDGKTVAISCGERSNLSAPE
jgi:hypothetical protein